VYEPAGPLEPDNHSLDKIIFINEEILPHTEKVDTTAKIRDSEMKNEFPKLQPQN
jgi:hypothetical protein